IVARLNQREARIQRLIFENLPKRQAAAEALHKALRDLERYFEQFKYLGSDLAREADPASFAPLKVFDEFLAATADSELWLSPNTLTSVDHLVGCVAAACNVAMYYAGRWPSDDAEPSAGAEEDEQPDGALASDEARQILSDVSGGVLKA